MSTCILMTLYMKTTYMGNPGHEGCPDSVKEYLTKKTFIRYLLCFQPGMVVWSYTTSAFILMEFIQIDYVTFQIVMTPLLSPETNIFPPLKQYKYIYFFLIHVYETIVGYINFNLVKFNNPFIYFYSTQLLISTALH